MRWGKGQGKAELVREGDVQNSDILWMALHLQATRSDPSNLLFLR